MDYPEELIGGEFVPPLVVRGKHVIGGRHRGTVYVEAGTLTIDGELHGTLNVLPNSQVTISGKHRGPVYAEKGSVVVVSGTVEGTTNIDEGSRLIVEESGVIKGSLFNNGSMVLRGVMSGAVNGGGEVKVEGSGQLKKPVIKDGLVYYQ